MSILACIYAALALGFCLGVVTCAVLTMSKRASSERK